VPGRSFRRAGGWVGGRIGGSRADRARPGGRAGAGHSRRRVASSAEDDARCVPRSKTLGTATLHRRSDRGTIPTFEWWLGLRDGRLLVPPGGRIKDIDPAVRPIIEDHWKALIAAWDEK
jgi:hypothetical protein